MSVLSHVRNGFEPDYNSDDYGLDCSADGVTKQSFAAECDVNNIVNRWLKSGQLPMANNSMAQYLDVSNVSDYHACLNMVLQAQSMFQALPASVRDRFQNDPGKFLEFAENPANAAEMVSLGLAVPREPSTVEPSAAQRAGEGEAVGGSPTPDVKPAVAPSGGV